MNRKLAFPFALALLLAGCAASHAAPAPAADYAAALADPARPATDRPSRAACR